MRPICRCNILRLLRFTFHRVVVRQPVSAVRRHNDHAILQNCDLHSCRPPFGEGAVTWNRCGKIELTLTRKQINRDENETTRQRCQIRNDSTRYREENIPPTWRGSSMARADETTCTSCGCSHGDSGNDSLILLIRRRHIVLFHAPPVLPPLCIWIPASVFSELVKLKVI